MELHLTNRDNEKINNLYDASVHDATCSPVLRLFRISTSTFMYEVLKFNQGGEKRGILENTENAPAEKSPSNLRYLLNIS